MINIKPSISNQDKTIKKSFQCQINQFARKNNISELTYAIVESQSIQSAIITYDNSTLETKTNQLKQQEILIFEDGHISNDVSKIKDLLFQQQCLAFSEKKNSDLFEEEQHSISLQQLSYKEEYIKNNNSKEQKVSHQNYQQQECINSVVQRQSFSQNEFNSITGDQLVLQEYGQQQNKHLDLLEKLQNNTDQNSNFKAIQADLFKKIKYFGYSLEWYVQTIDSADIFQGKFQSHDIIFKILYKKVGEDFQKEISIIKEFENQLIKRILINCLKLEGNNYVFVYFKSDYLELQNQLKMIKAKEWNLEKFNSINSPIFDRQIDQENIKQFKNNQELIIDKLEKQKYFLNKFLAQGGEGLIFDGYKQNSEFNYDDYAFKIIFHYSKNEIEEEVNIMKGFEKNINTIKLYDFIFVSNEILILVLEKCKYSLYDQLQKFLNKEIEFTQNKLFQIITSLLDGLIQFRIYNILHLDIKPQNILVTQSDDYVFSDFGMSSLLKGNKKIEVKGFTPQYASNEQIAQCLMNDNNGNKNKKNIDENVNYLSDVYSLGKTFISVLNVYKYVNGEEDLSVLETLIKINMLGVNQFNRKDCTSLYELFYKYFSSTSFKQYLESYSKQIDQILNLEIYDSNKDIPHFQDIILCYQLTQLDIQQNHRLQPSTNEFPEDCPDIYNSLFNVGVIYRDMGKNEEALKYTSEALDMRRKVIKVDHSDIIECLGNVGLIYRDLGQNEIALKYIQQSLEMSRRLFSGDHPHIAGSLTNVGLVYQDMGKNKDALKYLLEALEMTKKLYSGDNLHIAESLQNVGITYQDIGKYEDALKYMIQALEMQRRIFSGDRPDIAASLNNIGTIYRDICKNEDALKYMFEALEMQRKLFSGDHPTIAIYLNNVGLAYRDMSKIGDAFKYMFEALEMQRKVFSQNDHPTIAQSLNHIGLTYRDIGKNEDALKNMFQALEMMRRIYSEDHPDIAFSLNNIGLTYRNIGKNEDALKYLFEGLEMVKRMYSEENPHIASSLNNIGLTYRNMGRNEDALKYLLEGLEMRQRVFAGDHPDIAKSLDNVGLTYSYLGKNEEALKYVLEGLKMRRSVFSGDHPMIAASLNNVGVRYRALGQNQDALKYFLEALEMRRKVFSEDHSDIAKSLNNVGANYLDLGKNEDALKYFLEALEIRRKIFSGDHPDIAASLQNVGVTYRNLGKNADALKYILEGLEMRRKVFSGDHPAITVSLQSVGLTYSILGQNDIALQYYLEVLEIKRKVFRGDRFDVVKSLENVGLTYRDLGQYKNALKYMLDSLEMMKRIFNGDHQQIASTLNNISRIYKQLFDFKMAELYQFECLLMRRVLFDGTYDDIRESLFYLIEIYREIGDIISVTQLITVLNLNSQYIANNHS